MENRFAEGEIRTVDDYIELLKQYGRDTASHKVFRKYHLFELAISFCLLEMSDKLIHPNLKEVVEEYLSESTVETNITEVKAKIEQAGHT